MRKHLRTWALLAGLMASTSTIAACSSSEDEDTEEGELGGRFNREELFSGKWTNWYDRNVEPPKDLMGMLTRVGDFFGKKTNRASINGLFKL